MALLALLALAGCRRSEQQRAVDARPLLARYPIRPHVRWTEHREQDGRVTSRRREERWTAIGEGSWEVVTIDVETATPFYRARYSLLEDGLAQTAVLDGERVVPVDPPRLALPSNPTPGAAWQREHRVGAQRSTRACELVARDVCEEGLELRCTTSYGDGRVVVVRNRYCGGVGIVAYASTTHALGTDVAVRIWSEDLIDVAPPP